MYILRQKSGRWDIYKNGKVVFADFESAEIAVLIARRHGIVLLNKAA